jgi:hypothetical protein
MCESKQFTRPLSWVKTPHQPNRWVPILIWYEDFELLSPLFVPEEAQVKVSVIRLISQVANCFHFSVANFQRVIG